MLGPEGASRRTTESSDATPLAKYKAHSPVTCARRDRPRRRTAEQRDEVAAVHSITSSARASSEGGTSRPSALAVLRLITSSNVVGCSIGSWPGLLPLRILST